MYIHANPGVAASLLVSVSITVDLWYLARTTELWGSERLREPSGWEGEFLGI